MTDTNMSAVLYQKLDLRLEQRPILEAGPGEVQLRMQNVGICGSDVHFWQDGKIGDYVVREPLLLGHECSGIVSNVGEQVTRLKVGDRVAIEPHGVCHRCEACKTYRYNLCPKATFLGTPPDNGALARYHVHGEEFVFKKVLIPDNMSFEEGALVEPLSVGIHACRRSRVAVGDKVLICGAGPIGLCSLLVAKAFGASIICVTDISNSRLEFAKQIGATHTMPIKPSDEPQEVALKLADILGEHPNRAIECSGAQFSTHLGVYALKPGGVFALVGFGSDEVLFPVVDIVAKEIEIIGCFRYTHTWQTAIDMIANGTINVKPLISYRFKLEDTIGAFELAKYGLGIKVMIDCS